MGYVAEKMVAPIHPVRIPTTPEFRCRIRGARAASLERACFIANERKVGEMMRLYREHP